MGFEWKKGNPVYDRYIHSTGWRKKADARLEADSHMCRVCGREATDVHHLTHSVSIPNHNHKITIPKHSHTVTIPNHNHKITIPKHSHTVTIPDHTHNVTIPNHTHKVSIPGHTHNVSIPNHTHTITIPAHSHEITAGIFESGKPTAFDIYVNGSRKTTVRDTSYEGDITSWLLNESNQIPRDSWIDVEIRPNDLAYVQSSVFVQGFVQSRGGGNY